MVHVDAQSLPGFGTWFGVGRVRGIDGEREELLKLVDAAKVKVGGANLEGSSGLWIREERDNEWDEKGEVGVVLLFGQRDRVQDVQSSFGEEESSGSWKWLVGERLMCSE